MTQQEVFSTAKWVCAGPYAGNSQTELDANGTPFFPILRSKFHVENIQKATLRVLGLGFFHCYLNGKDVTADEFLPLATDYVGHENYPVDEELTGHRIYVPEYDVTDLLNCGENTLVIHFGGGWFTTDGTPCCGSHVPYGTAKAIYRLTLETDSGIVEFFSSEQDKIGDSYVKTYNFFTCEHHDYRGFDDLALTPDYDDSSWANAVPAENLDTTYLFTDCPADRLQETLNAVCLRDDGVEKCYDTGRNCTSVPYLKLTGPAGSQVVVLFAEEKNADGTPNMEFNYSQTFTAVSDGTQRIVRPMFTWFGYRYLKVIGNAELLYAKEIHTDIQVNSSFHCDNETLNWLYRAYINTQLSNLHGGIPSDCPHIERKGYTGDGQLTCHAVMNTLDAKAFYQKWIGDISDCQDIRTGHVQYTAPYFRNGGGPGGWGCAIIEVPYQYYKHYGDPKPIQDLYGQMQKYLGYLEAHSDRDLVVSDKEGCWCLGDWCAPETMILPAPFVNNYFYIKCLYRMIEIASVTGHEQDIPGYEETIRIKKDATNRAYYNFDEINYIGNRQGASAFAMDLGMGSEPLYQRMVQYYQKLGRYDTGIFGTDILTRVLFENGDGDLAVNLMASTASISFDGMRKAGSTTLWEYWSNAFHDRSHNHPMFGAVVAYLFDYVLGIRAKNGCAGYTEIEIAPFIPSLLNEASGHRTLPGGEVHVSWKKENDSVNFTISIPDKLPAHFCWNEIITPLHPGTNEITVTA